MFIKIILRILATTSEHLSAPAQVQLLFNYKHPAWETKPATTAPVQMPAHKIIRLNALVIICTGLIRAACNRDLFNIAQTDARATPAQAMTIIPIATTTIILIIITITVLTEHAHITHTSFAEEIISTGTIPAEHNRIYFLAAPADKLANTAPAQTRNRL